MLRLIIAMIKVSAIGLYIVPALLLWTEVPGVLWATFFVLLWILVCSIISYILLYEID